MERIDEWPRVHTCLNSWCPKQSDECKRCDAVVELVRNKRAVDAYSHHFVNHKSDEQICWSCGTVIPRGLSDAETEEWLRNNLGKQCHCGGEWHRTVAR